MASTYLEISSEVAGGGGGGGSGVTSFNSRSGDVLSTAGDYSATQITNVAAGNISSTTVQAAINELDSEKQATVTGAASTITSSNLATSVALVSNGSGKVAASSVTATELGYVSGVTSALQTQLNAKQATVTGAATTIVSSDLATSVALVSDGSGKIAASAVTATELGYVSGVTSALQTQLNAKQATVTGAATTITSSNLATSVALVSNGSGKVAASAVTATELGYVSGVTSALQTQLGAKQDTITGAATTITSSNLATSVALVSNGSGKVAASSVTATELGYVSGVTSAIQTQINSNKISALTFVIDGGGSIITTGIKSDIVVPYACTINSATLIADKSGSIVLDLWKDTYANYPPTVTGTITASAKPTLSSATKSQDSTLTGWTTSVAAGDIIRLNVDSVSTVTRITLVLKVTKS